MAVVRHLIAICVLLSSCDGVVDDLPRPEPVLPSTQSPITAPPPGTKPQTPIPTPTTPTTPSNNTTIKPNPIRGTEPVDAGTVTPEPPDAGNAPDAGCCGDGTCTAWCQTVGHYCNPQAPTNPGECTDPSRTCVGNNHTGNWQCARTCDPCNNTCPKGQGCVGSFCWPGYKSVACEK